MAHAQGVRQARDQLATPAPAAAGIDFMTVTSARQARINLVELEGAAWMEPATARGRANPHLLVWCSCRRTVTTLRHARPRAEHSGDLGATRLRVTAKTWCSAALDPSPGRPTARPRPIIPPTRKINNRPRPKIDG